MSALRISLAEKRLLQHLQLGGSVDDPVGRELVVKFASIALDDLDVGPIAKRYAISMQDICFIYAAMIKHLMPNPCIISGALLLVPTLYFMEPFRFEGLVSEVHARSQGLPESERLAKMEELSNISAKITWDAHTMARGEAPFTIQPLGGLKSASGCAAVLIAGVMLILVAGYSAYRWFA